MSNTTQDAFNKLADSLEIDLKYITTSIGDMSIDTVSAIDSLEKTIVEQFELINESLVILSLPMDIRSEARKYYSKKRHISVIEYLYLNSPDKEHYKTMLDTKRDELYKFREEHPALILNGVV
jgi:hypothetical protein